MHDSTWISDAPSKEIAEARVDGFELGCLDAALDKLQKGETYIEIRGTARGAGDSWGDLLKWFWDIASQNNCSLTIERPNYKLQISDNIKFTFTKEFTHKIKKKKIV
jgi:hypothetical protein